MSKPLNLDDFKMGYFALYESTGHWIHNAIEREQVSRGFPAELAKFIHIDVLGGGPYAVRVNPPKTKITDIREQYRGRRMVVVRYKNPDFIEKKRYKVAFWAASHCNLVYDYWGVLRFKLGWLIRERKNLFFCSENAAWALQKEFPGAFSGMEPSKVMPAHFLNELYFEIVWEGVVP